MCKKEEIFNGFTSFRAVYLNAICLAFFFLLSGFSFSQTIPLKFKKTADSLIKAAPKTYTDIDSILKPSRYDTILMRHFNNEAAAKKYFNGQSYALNQLGTWHRNTSSYAKAINLHKQALELAKKADNLELKVYSLNMLSVVYRRMDAIKTALDYAQEALALAEGVKNPSKGLRRSINVSLNGIGNIYQSLKQYPVAIETYKKSLLLEKELNNTLGLAINNQNLGECYEELNDLKLALNYYRKSLALNEEINSDRGRVICNNSIAKIYIKQNRLNEALRILNPTLKKAIAISDKFITTSVYINMGWAYIKLGNFELAETNLLEGILLAKKHDLHLSQALGHEFLSELYSKQNKFDQALQSFKTYKSIEDGINNETNIRYVQDIIFKYDSEKKNNQIETLARQNELIQLKLKKKENTLLISALLLALSVIILYILYKQYQLKNDKKLLTLEQSMLRSQMNPHFIFNSLNSIKLYIINNEKKNAVYYLNKFSKLVRKILEASSLKEITLAEELETAELYMNIENIRFSNEIGFTINIQEGLDVDAIKIPSLILQPFLENSIWHGLSSKEGEKQITIDIQNQDNYLIAISITDNGIGRDASEVIKENKVLKRNSIGITITKERLENFSKDYQNSYDVTIIDLYDENNLAIGTKVVVLIPTI
ncbi:tetratricopeptide repeat protein [Cellulophaga sp. Hel_I_12]|uniref:tetratricopeptide repeat protein n=1 Tax=Cellulophaga sp. Hel_I_12 TaxID=1249972 RepID=UPI000648C14F|nr:tetratricopeptide repeat protein [Cellulophaga sp. Hel_I_12]